MHILSYKDVSRLIEPVIVERECAGLPSANSEGPPSRERLKTGNDLDVRTKVMIEQNMNHGIKYLTFNSNILKKVLAFA